MNQYYFFECTLEDTLAAKSCGLSSSAPQVRPEFLIYTAKRDDGYVRPFRMGVPSGDLNLIDTLLVVMQHAMQLYEIL